MTAWLRHHAAMTSRDAARTVARAKRLRDMPATASAWQAGELGSGQVDAILAALRPSPRHLFADHETDLVPSLVGLSVADTTRAMAAWSAHAEALSHEDERAEPERALHLSKTLDGSWAVDGTLDAKGGSVVAAALRLAESPDAPAEPGRTPAQRRADALGDVCRFFLDHQQLRPGGRHRPHVNVVIDCEDLAEHRAGRVVDGPVLDGAAMQALVCDSALHRVLMAGRSAVPTTAPPPGRSPLRCGTHW